ncbi:MAG: hypothetical protein IIB77_12835, partial [Proteobacteria bacterium]|nr:hypothetical protein [Pseudomonadota bacterium]
MLEDVVPGLLDWPQVCRAGTAFHFDSTREVYVMSLSDYRDCPFCGHVLTHTAEFSRCDQCKATNHPTPPVAKQTIAEFARELGKSVPPEEWDKFDAERRLHYEDPSSASERDRLRESNEFFLTQLALIRQQCGQKAKLAH